MGSGRVRCSQTVAEPACELSTSRRLTTCFAGIGVTSAGAAFFAGAFAAFRATVGWTAGLAGAGDGVAAETGSGV